MKLLIIGGTRFVGRHLVENALARGHEITLFYRGQTNPDLFPSATHLHGDRKTEEGMSLLSGQQWDAVIDTCGYEPKVTNLSAQTLKDRVELYCFISTISVYKNPLLPNSDENAPLGRLDNLTNLNEVTLTNETYGPLKVHCEEGITEILGARALHIRPGLIVGPHDPTDRFTYWPHRVMTGGNILAPGTPELAAQFVDARDLAAWTLDAVEAKLSGAYNVAGRTVTFGAILRACEEATGMPSEMREIKWIPEAWLQENGVQPWVELPLWISSNDADMAGFNTMSSAKAIAAGLTYRPLLDTVRDTMAWDKTRIITENSWKNTLKPEREEELIALLS